MCDCGYYGQQDLSDIYGKRICEILLGASFAYGYISAGKRNISDTNSFETCDQLSVWFTLRATAIEGHVWKEDLRDFVGSKCCVWTPICRQTKHKGYRSFRDMWKAFVSNGAARTGSCVDRDRPESGTGERGPIVECLACKSNLLQFMTKHTQQITEIDLCVPQTVVSAKKTPSLKHTHSHNMISHVSYCITCYMLILHRLLTAYANDVGQGHAMGKP